MVRGGQTLEGSHQNLAGLLPADKDSVVPGCVISGGLILRHMSPSEGPPGGILSVVKLKRTIGGHEANVLMYYR